ncbi:MAG TPA: decaprenyl-phosphate phosphoribosyltransferase [Vitreimonas sp.]|nr:decaprenyl-phosphate phosphoribosyltransferase [Vitreimonas sp.]
MFDSLPFLILRTARPRQWIKNLALYAALVFSGFFFFTPQEGLPYAVTVTYAFGIFCILTSSVYIINDIIDYEADAKHPFKKKRPIASGKLPIPVAVFTAIAGLTMVFFLSLWLSGFFRLLILSYLCLQVLYAKVTKHIPILDVVSIATGFLIRIYAGAVVVNLHMSVWFLLTVVSASLFLAVGKRQSERTLMAGKVLGETRKALKGYSERLLDQYTGMFANATWLTYALFTFQNEVVRPDERLADFYTILPRTLQSQKLLMLTLPFVIFGVMRYLQLVYESNEGESPERVLLSDKPLLLTTFMFGASVMVVIYFLS